MKYVRIIPCLDFKDSRVVKGVNFVDLRDAGDPVEQAAFYDKEGADEIAFLDISATNDNRSTAVDMARRVAEVVSVPFTVGGGIRSVGDIYNLLNAGAKKVSINSRAFRQPSIISEASAKFGRDTVVLAIDVKPAGIAGKYEVYLNGGREATGMDMVEWAKRGEDLGACEILLTGMNTDGTKGGYDIDMLKAVSSSVSIPVIASGGAGSLQHFCEAVLEGGAQAVLAASLFHFRELTIKEVKEYLSGQGIPVRL